MVPEGFLVIVTHSKFSIDHGEGPFANWLLCLQCMFAFERRSDLRLVDVDIVGLI